MSGAKSKPSNQRSFNHKQMDPLEYLDQPPSKIPKLFAAGEPVSCRFLDGNLMDGVRRSVLKVNELGAGVVMRLVPKFECSGVQSI